MGGAYGAYGSYVSHRSHTSGALGVIQWLARKAGEQVVSARLSYGFGGCCFDPQPLRTSPMLMYA